MIIDLHNHSKHSDGKLTVKELIEYAKSHNISIMALTDHDSTYGCDEAYQYGCMVGVDVIPGIELSTNYNNESVHIIGLFRNRIIPKAIYDKADEIKSDRRKRAIRMMENIKEIFNVKIDMEELLQSEVITRGNMYQHILKHNKELSLDKINYMVSHQSPAYIEVSRFETPEGIKFLKENNCITIYAHPTLNSNKTVLEVCEMGVDGIEYRYPKNKDGEEDYFKSIAKEKGMLLSAGSDFHSDINHADIGTVSLDYEDYLKIKERLGL